MKIAVIGGSGFVGTRLIDILISTGQYNLLNIDKNVSKKFSDISVIGNVMDKDTLVSQLQN